MDPIADQFPHVSVYNYAENRVPGGIDLWGLQFEPPPLPSLEDGAPPRFHEREKYFENGPPGAPQIRPNLRTQSPQSESRNDNSGSDQSSNVKEIGLTAAGAIYGGLEGATASQGYWLGENGKYNNQQWGGNKYTGSRSGAFRAANAYKLAGRATIGGSAILGATMTYQGYVQDGGEFGYNAQRAAAGSTGSIMGGMAGAKAGVLIGGAAGAWIGGVGAVPGAVIGGIIGGLGLGIGGSYLGGLAGEKAVDNLHKP